MCWKVKILLVLIVILTTTGISGAGIGENSLQVSLIKYDPYPVSPGSDLSIWVQVKNVGNNDVSSASIEFVPKYPFSIKSGESSVKYPGTIREKDEIVYKYIVNVDKNAFVGTNTLEMGYRVNGKFTKKEFDIEVGNEVVNSRGTVRLEEYIIDPETLMPGDSATVTLVLKNSATEYTIEMDGSDYSMNAQIQSARFSGTDEVEVTCEPYSNVGIISPGDSVELPYSIKVNNNTPDGTYFLDFELEGSARLYSLNLRIPVTVDSSDIGTVLSESPGLNPGKIILNVANNRQNTVQAATVVPAGNATFEPAEYFIGTMEPDELFTVKFDMKENSELEDARFSVRFKNGNNWHESAPLVVMLNDTKTEATGNKDNSSFPLSVAVILVSVIIVISGFFIFMKRKRARSGAGR